jgi:hypothetical protein
MLVVGDQARSERPGEQIRELAARELRAHVGGVRRLLEQVGVGVEGDADPRVAKNPADLRDVEPDVDDQVAREGVPEIVEAHLPIIISL